MTHVAPGPASLNASEYRWHVKPIQVHFIVLEIATWDEVFIDHRLF